MSETIELKPCAHCGHQAYIRGLYRTEAIVCTSCGANIPARNETFDAQLVAAWNRRHTDAAPSAWIPCDERLPEVGEYGRSDFVWAHARGGDVFKGEYNIGDEKWYDVCNDEWIAGVTHWRELPLPPGTDAAPGEAELGRELIAWAADRENAYSCESYTVPFCIFCEALAGHKHDCLHLRARALRDSE